VAVLHAQAVELTLEPRETFSDGKVLPLRPGALRVAEATVLAGVGWRALPAGGPRQRKPTRGLGGRHRCTARARHANGSGSTSTQRCRMLATFTTSSSAGNTSTASRCA